MKTTFGQLHYISNHNVIYYSLMNILLFCLLFIEIDKKESCYLLGGFVLTIFLLIIWLLFHLMKHMPNSKKDLMTIFFCIGLLIFCIILSYANFYHLIYELRGKVAFSGNSLKANDFLYFSITTFTTTGYGDITSIGPISNLVAATEMLMGYSINTITMGVIATKIYQSQTSKKDKPD